MKNIIFDYRFEVEKRVHLNIDELVNYVDENDKTLYDVIQKYVNNYKYRDVYFSINNKYEVLNDIKDCLIIETIQFDEDEFDEDDDFIEYIDNNIEDYSVEEFTFEDLIELKNSKR